MSVTPAGLKGDRSGLVIEWSDGAVQRLRWELLRARCPCANCRVEREKPRTGLPILVGASAEPVRGVGMEPVGNYAYHIRFSDGHSSGIFSLEFLRELGEAEGERGAGSGRHER